MNDRVAVGSDASGEATKEKPRMRVGIVGWRGMVGSVLMRRMLEENDFALIEPEFCTTSNVGGEGPAIRRPVGSRKDEQDIAALAAHNVIITCQGGEYT